MSNFLSWVRRFLPGAASAAQVSERDPNYSSDEFMQIACQYYVAARFAMHAQVMPVTGNLFHLAVEMSLKAALARKRSLSDLKNMGHDLKKLWPAFKIDFPNPAFRAHDKTISRVNKFGEIRYPESKHSLAIAAEWCDQPVPVVATAGMKTPKQYPLVISDVDDLIVDVFKVCSLNPALLIGRNGAALEAITRRNRHSEFLTGSLPA